MQKEHEKEKRRLRDRERRQTMSLEDRERHLARRRKNYQIRRLKGVSLQSPQTTPVLLSPDLSEDSSEQSPCTVPESFRLRHMKRLARCLHYSDGGSNATSDLKFEENRTKATRLSHLKNMARKKFEVNNDEGHSSLHVVHFTNNMEDTTNPEG